MTYEQLTIFEASMTAEGIKQSVRYLFSPGAVLKSCSSTETAKSARLGAAPEHISSLGEDSSGWLERYIVMRSSRPYEYWRWCYRMDGRIRHHHVPSGKYVAIAYLINQRSPIAEIKRYLKRPPGL